MCMKQTKKNQNTNINKTVSLQKKHHEELNRVPAMSSKGLLSPSLSDTSHLQHPHLRENLKQKHSSMMTSWRVQSSKDISPFQHSPSSQSPKTSSPFPSFLPRNFSLCDESPLQASSKSSSSHQLSVPATLFLQTDSSFRDWLEIQFANLHDKIDRNFSELVQIKAMITNQTEEVCNFKIIEYLFETMSLC